jgi:hypothetical protein
MNSDDLQRMAIPPLLVGPFSEYRVIVDGRVVPNLTGIRCPHTGKISLCVDRRFAGQFSTEEDARQAAWLIAEAMAIASGYPHFGADSKDRPFAPRAMEVRLDSDGGVEIQ